MVIEKPKFKFKTNKTPKQGKACDHIVEINDAWGASTISADSIPYSLMTMGGKYRGDYYACKYCPECGHQLSVKKK